MNKKNIILYTNILVFYFKFQKKLLTSQQVTQISYFKTKAVA